MRVIGLEIRQFIESAWPPGYTWEEDTVFNDGRDLYRPDGTFAIADAEAVDVPGFWTLQFSGDLGPGCERDDLDVGHGLRFAEILERHLKRQATRPIIVNVPIDDVEAARQFLQAKGWLTA